jgi:hypothetical protein
MRRLPFLLLSLGAVSCSAPLQDLESSGAPALAWRLVESSAAGGRELVLEAYDPTGTVRLSIRFTRELATVGEVVEAEVRLPEETGRRRLEIVPDRPGVEILGPREVWADGPEPVRVRFTCRKPGRGGITVRIRD